MRSVGGSLLYPDLDRLRGQNVETFYSSVNLGQLNLETSETTVFQSIKGLAEAQPIFGLDFIVNFGRKLIFGRSQENIDESFDGFGDNIAVFLMIVLNTFEVKVNPKKHLIFLKEELIFSVPDCVFVIVFDDLFSVQVTQDQLVDSVVMIHVDFFVSFHHLV
jgi:hypothetical protein